MDKKYTKKLEDVIKRMLQPLKGIPFNLVIEGISGNKVISFNPKNNKDKELLQNLIKVAKKTAKEVNKVGIKRPRANEVGNDIELFVKKALKKAGYKADIPITPKGKKKSTGYPDIEFIDKHKRSNYLECKTYNVENVSTTQRSFYLSPSNEFKVTKDAHHFVISFEVYISGRRNQNNVYKCKSWKIIDITHLYVDVKYEFQSDNKRLYAKNLILAEGNIGS